MVNATTEPEVPPHPPIVDLSQSKEKIAADIMDAGKNVGYAALTATRVLAHSVACLLYADLHALLLLLLVEAILICN